MVAVTVTVTFFPSSNPSTKTPGFQPETSQDVWPRFTVPGLEYKVLDLNLTTDRALKSRECYFWNNYIPQLQTMLGEKSRLKNNKQQISINAYM